MNEKITHERYIQLMHTFFRLRSKMDFFEVPKGELMLLRLVQKCQEEGKAGSVSQIASCLEVSSPAVSRMIRTLEKKDLLQKKPLSEDRRSTCLSLTPKGQQVVSRADETINRMSERLLNQIGKEWSLAFANDCEKFLNAMENVIEDENNRKKELTNSENML